MPHACSYTRPPYRGYGMVDKCFVWKVPFAWMDETNPRLEIPSGPVTSRFISNIRKLEPHEYPTLLQ